MYVYVYVFLNFARSVFLIFLDLSGVSEVSALLCVSGTCSKV